MNSIDLTHSALKAPGFKPLLSHMGHNLCRYEQEVTKQLTANNPNAPSNIARFSMKEKQYKFEPMVDQLVMHYASDGYLLHKVGLVHVAFSSLIA